MVRKYIMAFIVLLITYIEILIIVPMVGGRQIINPIEYLKQHPVLFVITLLVEVIWLLIESK